MQQSAMCRMRQATTLGNHPPTPAAARCVHCPFALSLPPTQDVVEQLVKGVCTMAADINGSYSSQDVVSTNKTNK